MADYLDDIVQNIVTKCDLSDFNLLIHATDDLAKKANKLSGAFNRALTGEQQVALAKSNEIISHNVARQKEATMALAEHNKEISWNKVLLAEQNRLKAENNNATKIATQDRDKQISQERLQTQLSKERTAQMRKETSEMRKQSVVMRTLGRLFFTYFSIRTLQNIVNMGSQLQLLQRSIEGLTGSGQDWQFINDQAFKFGVSLDTVAKGYKNFFSSANMAGFNSNQIQGMFSDVLLGARSIGASTQQIEGALLALEQMMSKGRVSMEELRRQLGNALPGAFEIGAKAMGVTTQAFNQLVKDGLSAQEFVPKFIKTFKEQYANGWKDVEQTVAVAQGRLQVAWQQFTMEFLHGESGKALAEGINALADMLRTPEFTQFVKMLSQVFTWVSKIFTWIIRNHKMVLAFLGTAGLYGLLQKNSLLFRLFTKDIGVAIRFLRRFGLTGITAFKGLGAGAKALQGAIFRTLLPLFAIEDIVFGLGQFFLGWNVRSLLGDALVSLKELGDVRKDPFGLENMNQNLLPGAFANNLKYNPRFQKEYNNAITSGKFDQLQNLYGGNYSFNPSEYRKGNYVLGAPMVDMPGYVTGKAANIGYVGDLPNLTKEETNDYTITMGDVIFNISGAGNPLTVAEAVNEQFSNLLIGQMGGVTG